MYYIYLRILQILKLRKEKRLKMFFKCREKRRNKSVDRRIWAPCDKRDHGYVRKGFW
jgi:hypothetical protein